MLISTARTLGYRPSTLAIDIAAMSRGLAIRLSGMREVVVYELLSLDGVGEDPDGFISEWDEAMDANLASVIATQDCVILGRRSYDEWAAFWLLKRDWEPAD
jgi:hypothetical protein